MTRRSPSELAAAPSAAPPLAGRPRPSRRRGGHRQDDAGRLADCRGPPARRPRAGRPLLRPDPGAPLRPVAGGAGRSAWPRKRRGMAGSQSQQVAGRFLQSAGQQSLPGQRGVRGRRAALLPRPGPPRRYGVLPLHPGRPSRGLTRPGETNARHVRRPPTCLDRRSATNGGLMAVAQSSSRWQRASGRGTTCVHTEPDGEHATKRLDEVPLPGLRSKGDILGHVCI